PTVQQGSHVASLIAIVRALRRRRRLKRLSELTDGLIRQVAFQSGTAVKPFRDSSADFPAPSAEIRTGVVMIRSRSTLTLPDPAIVVREGKSGGCSHQATSAVSVRTAEDEAADAERESQRSR